MKKSKHLEQFDFTQYSTVHSDDQKQPMYYLNFLSYNVQIFENQTFYVKSRKTTEKIYQKYLCTLFLFSNNSIRVAQNFFFVYPFSWSYLGKKYIIKYYCTQRKYYCLSQVNFKQLDRQVFCNNNKNEMRCRVYIKKKLFPISV